jgi:hypothetical protein
MPRCARKGRDGALTPSGHRSAMTLPFGGGEREEYHNLRKCLCINLIVV